MSKVILGNTPRRVPATSKVRPPTEAIPANFDPSRAVTYEKTQNTTTHDFEVPDNLVSGDIGLAIIRAWAAITAIPSGWTELATLDAGKTKVIWRRLDGTEVDSTFSTGSAVTSVGMTWVVPKGEASSLPDPEISAAANASSGNIDTPALTPSTAGRTLVMSLWYSSESSYTDSDSYLPAGYAFIGSGLDKHSGNFQTINAAYAYVDITTSENPPAWNFAGSDWHGWTVGVLSEDTGAAVAAGDHTHVEADVTDLDHWTETDHDALDHTGLTGVGVADHGGLSGLSDDDHAAVYAHSLGGRVPFSNHGNTGATETVDFSLAAVHRLTLDANCTITLSGPVGTRNGGTVAEDVVIELDQDATGSRTVTWPGSVTWVGGSAPTLATAANSRDVIVLYTVDGGTSYLGVHVGAGGGASAFDDLSDVTLTGYANGQGVFYRTSSSLWENARSPEPLTSETPDILYLEDDSVAMSEPFFD